MHKTPRMRRIEEDRGKPIEQIIVDAYNRHGSIRKAAGELGMDPAGLLGWMNRLGIRVETSTVAVLPGEEAPSADPNAA